MFERLQKHVHTLRFSILAMVLLCWLVPTLILGVYMGTRVLDALRDKTGSALRSGAEYAMSMTVRNVSAVTTLARDVVYDGEISDAVQDRDAGKISYESYYQLVRGYLDRKFGREENCVFALFFRPNDPDSVIYTSQGYSAAVRFLQDGQDRIRALCETLDTSCRFVRVGDGGCLVRNLHNLRLERYGVLVIGLNMEGILKPALEAARAWDSACAVTLDDYTRGAFLGDGAETGLREQGDRLCCTLDGGAGENVLRFQVQADRHAVFRDMDAFRALLAYLLILVVPVCLMIMFFVDKRIVRPIAILSDASDRIRGGELGLVVPMRGNDELGRLGVAFSDMSVKLKQLIDKSYKEEIALRDARIQAMQSRINPHFLNNALEAVNWQARLSGADKVSEMVGTLSVLLNASLDRSERHLVPLREELDLVDAYFYFATLQFGKRLTILKSVDEQLLEARVPRLIVQMLAENAVEHGIAPAGGGEIRLNVFAREERLFIEVANGGAKLTAEDLQRIAALLDDRCPPGGHLGIRNVNERLRLIFGEAAGLRFTVDSRGETVATICQPVAAEGYGGETGGGDRL